MIDPISIILIVAVSILAGERIISKILSIESECMQFKFSAHAEQHDRPAESRHNSVSRSADSSESK